MRIKIWITTLAMIITAAETSVSNASDTQTENDLSQSFESLLNSPSGLFYNVSVPYNKKLTIINGRAINPANQILDSILQDVKTLQTIFENFETVFEKEKNTTDLKERERRLNVFKTNLKSVLAHNSKSKQHTYEKGVNLFSDMTEEEVIKHYTGFLPAPKNSVGRSMSMRAATPKNLENLSPPQLNKRGKRVGRWWGGSTVAGWGSFGANLQQSLVQHKVSNPYYVPNSIDWRSYGALSPVKNQLSCGSCTLFAASTLLESAMFIWHGGPLLDLSEQELLDCIPPQDGITGCEGNWYEAVLRYLNNTGQGTDTSYPSPYQNEKEDHCRKGTPAAKLTNYYLIPQTEADLKRYVGLFGPVAASIHVNNDILSYSSGIYQGNCTGDINHSIVIVGYGSDRGVPYWLIRNSWSTAWGEQGYFRLRRNFNNMCQIASYAFLGTA